VDTRGIYWAVWSCSLALAVTASAQDSIKSSSLQKAMVPKGSVAIARDKQVTVIQTVDESEPVRVSPSAVKPKASVSRVPIALNASDDKSDLSSVRVVEGKGTIAFEAGAPMLEQRSSGTSVLSSGHAKTIAETSKLNTETKTGLPWMVVDVKQDALSGTAPAPIVRTARPFLLLARAVQWLPDAERYSAELIVGLDAEDGSRAGPLEEPFTATLSTSCEEVDPPRVQLARIGPDGDQKVKVSCSPKQRASGRPQQLTVRIASGQLSYPFELPANPGPYALISSASDVPGLGLSTVRLTVSQALEDGSPLALERDVEVPLQSSTGELHPSVLTIPRGKSEASADVRVFGLGALNVQAGAGARVSKPLEITRSWPLLFLFATLFGGAAGGYLAIVRQRRGNPEHARARTMLVRRVLEGALVGLIAVGALLTTPGLAELMPDVARGSQLAWLISSVLAGFLGVELIEVLASKLVPKKA
jgi:hypothetical protein